MRIVQDILNFFYYNKECFSLKYSQRFNLVFDYKT